MKRATNLLPLILELDNLRLASWKAAKGKRYTASVLEYQADLEGNLEALRQQIEQGQVVVGDYRYFKVFEPKERQICASAFREQVLHHALMNICHDRFEKMQLFDSYASRQGKGVYAALERAKIHTRDHAWFLKLDVRKFFESIHHAVLKKQLLRLFKEQKLLHIFFQIIDSYEAHPERGVPIGNLTSQYFANHYLAGLDHFIKEKLFIVAYVRYMDDMVLWHSNPAILRSALTAIEDFVQQYLCCQLKPPILQWTQQGVPFLGYNILPRQVRLLRNSTNRFVRKIGLVEECYHEGYWTERACQEHALPLIAFTQHADATTLRKNVLLRLQGSFA